MLPVTKPIYTSSSISKGMHILHLARGNVRSTQFFPVMEPSVNIELGRVFIPTRARRRASPGWWNGMRRHNKRRFKPGVHGSICFNMDEEMHCHYEEMHGEELDVSALRQEQHGKEYTLTIWSIQQLAWRVCAPGDDGKDPHSDSLNGGELCVAFYPQPRASHENIACLPYCVRIFTAKAVAISNELCFHAGTL